MQKKGETSRLTINLLIGFLILALAVIIFIIVRGYMNDSKQEVLSEENLDFKISQVKQIDEDTLIVTVIRNTGEGNFEGLSFLISDGNMTEIIKVNTSMQENESEEFSIGVTQMNVSKIKIISISPVYIDEEGLKVTGGVKDEYITPNVCSTYCPPDAQCGVSGCGLPCGNGCAKGYFCLNYKCIREKTSSGGGGGGSGGSGGSTCTDTCSSLKYNCGTHTICGKSVSCGTCQSGYNCETNGTCVKDTTCVPKTCQGLGRVCGEAPDECGGTLDCGICQTGYNCNSNGSCTQIPCTDTCSSLKYVCGNQSICGIIQNCGTCQTGYTCNSSGMCECKPESNSEFCSRLGKNCGRVTGTDNCGKSKTVQNCGTCTTPETCGGGGTANVCGCTPTTCSELGRNCGTVSNGCGGTLTCGSYGGGCQTGYSCAANGTCVKDCVPNCAGKQCGDNGCGGSCGICSSGYSCAANGTCVKSGGGSTPTGAIIADHNAANDFDIIPACWITEAKRLFKITYHHTSHGSQIPSGMEYLVESVNPTLYSYSSLLTDNYDTDLGNGNWKSITISDLNNKPSLNTAMWSWCGQAGGYTTNSSMYSHYLGPAENLVSTRGIYFIYMTGHLEGTGPSGDLYKANNIIRQHVQNIGGVLFDFADIESYDPAGNYDPNGSDECEWCYTWCSNHPSDCYNLNIGCAHSHPFNCVRKGKAFWWMMARMAGWDGTAGASCP